MSRRLTTQTDADVLIEHLYKGKGTLTPALEEKLDRLQSCLELTRKYGSRLKVIPMLVKKYNRDGKKYSAHTAQEDFDDCQEVFGAGTQTNRMFWFDIVLGMMMDTRNAILATRNYKAASLVEVRMLNAIKDFIGDNEAYPVDKLQPQNVEVGFFPELLNVKLPDNLEEQLKKLKEAKKRKDLMIEGEAQDAEVIPNE
ncbi:hypothetical protein EFA69_16170 [Rufibacter immobilis]|uniref:Uncharacterized protein n=1 Tax=Rufibacter immobilis TaxID=1348778 RepID=A0A3M9MRY8_9BACT|nr:hypothetical protein [Rufibacter immobilis]RNI27653.1 hypothetical protein EFA69_16170 [Rufibacter immobilis]